MWFFCFSDSTFRVLTSSSSSLILLRKAAERCGQERFDRLNDVKGKKLTYAI